MTELPSFLAPPKQPDSIGAKLAAIQPVLDRVRRSDHWYVAPGQSPYRTNAPLNDEALRRHFAGIHKIGAAPMERGSSTTRIALLDLDDHDKNLPWQTMAETARKLISTGAERGIRLVPFTSSGGAGLHLYALWNQPQDARSVRAAMSSILAAHGMKNGTRGVAAGTVEVFPKSDSIAPNGHGAMWVLPLTGKSVPLDPATLDEIGIEAIRWPTSDEVPFVEPPAPIERTEYDAPELARVQSALDALDPSDCDYDSWLRTLYATHDATGGSAEGLAMMHAWSSRWPSYDVHASHAETTKQWQHAKTKPGGIGAGSLFHAARLAGWIPLHAPTAEGFPNLVEEAAQRLHATYVAGDWDAEDVALMSDEVVAELEKIDPEVAALAREAAALTQGAIDKAKAGAVGAPRMVLSSVGLTVALPERFHETRNGHRPASDANLALACQRPDIIGCVLGFDTFRDELMLSNDGGKSWAPFCDEHYTQIKLRLTNEHRFQKIAAESLREHVYAAARHNRFDSAQAWLQGLPAWDGVARIDAFCSRYLGTEDREYTRAVGAYLWTAAAGRIMEPGIKADMVPVLVGPQGKGKSTSIAAISPSPDFFGELALDARDADLSRKLKGLLVGELAELRGLATRELEAIKNFITQRFETWTPKYKEMPVTFARRCVFMGSTNEHEFLADKTGERRWLPVTVGECRPDLIERDRAQLWAEGRARFRANGIEWQAAERLAEGEHEQYKAPDLWEDQIAGWLATDGMDGVRNDARPFTLGEVTSQALHLEAKNVKRADENRVGKILRSLGYEPTQVRIDGVKARRWQRK